MEKDEINEETTPTPTGRARRLAAYKAKYPEKTEDPTDDEMYDDSHNEYEELRGKYDGLNSTNEKVAQKAMSDPYIAKFLSMLFNGEDPYYVMGKVFGDLPSQLDDESLEQLRKGQEERKAGYAKWQENSAAYVKKVNDYAAANNLTPENATQLHETLGALESAFAMYEIPDEVIDIVWKGIDSEAAQNAAAEAAALAARNEVIDETKTKKAGKTEVPDMNGAGSNGRKPKPNIEIETTPADFGKRFKEV